MQLSVLHEGSQEEEAVGADGKHGALCSSLCAVQRRMRRGHGLPVDALVLRYLLVEVQHGVSAQVAGQHDRGPVKARVFGGQVTRIGHAEDTVSTLSLIGETWGDKRRRVYSYISCILPSDLKPVRKAW